MVAAEEFFSEEITTDQPIQVEPQSMSANDFFGGGEVEIAQPETEEEKLNFATRVGQDMDKRLEVFKEITRAVESGEQSTAEGVLQVAGKFGIGIVFDLLGETLVSGARGISAITPDIIEDPVKDAVTAAAHEFLNTDVGKAGLETAQKSAQLYERFKRKNPVAARNIESVVNIGLLVAPVSKSAKPTTAEPTTLGRAATAVETAGVEQQASLRTSFIDDLVRPKQTAAVKAEQVGRTTEEGLLRSKEVALSPAEKAMAATIETVPEVTGAKTLQGNFNAISEEVGKEANRLLATLEASPVKISRGEVNKSLDLAQKRLAQTPTLVGDAAKTAERLITEAKRIVSKNPQTSAGLLKSRQQFDRFITSQKKATVFDPALENATTLAVRDVRQTLNSLIDIKNPSQGVKQSLSRQSKLLSAMDNISPKAAQEGSNVVSRAWQNVSKILPIRGEFNQTLATIFGIGGLGAAATFAPIFTKAAGLGIGSYAAGKFIMGPQAKKGVSMLLKKMDQGIKVATDPDMVRQLRADRAALVELLRISNGNTTK